MQFPLQREDKMQCNKLMHHRLSMFKTFSIENKNLSNQTSSSIMQLEEAQGKLQNRWIDLDHFRSAFLLKTTFFSKIQDLGRFLFTIIHVWPTAHWQTIQPKSKSEKNYPTHSDCVLSQVWVYMSTTQNIRGCLWSSKRTCFS